ncbi:MAG: DNA gyrase C-terminal beta-propeller domain-containing protein, partial [Planctomycetaceae bacterium]|nr:DNA gyrase C-terminal beta-propeller domain-containing protein [Planctomycetaceae bacterium]
TARNGKVVDILSITEDDDILMVTSQGKIQRIHGKDISVIGRNTQGVRLIRLGDGDTLAGCASIPGELSGDDDEDLGGPAVAPVEAVTPAETDSAEPVTDIEPDEDAIGEEE